jgi:hypothetical protein
VIHEIIVCMIHSEQGKKIHIIFNNDGI